MENVFSNSVIHAGLCFSQVLNIDMLVQPFSCNREHMFVNIFPFWGLQGPERQLYLLTLKLPYIEEKMH